MVSGQKKLEAILMMATSPIGTLTEFNPGEEQEVASYVEKFELFCEANNIAEEKKVAVFLTAIGSNTYEILRQHCKPSLLKEKSFEEIVILLKQHFDKSVQDEIKTTIDSAQSQPQKKKVS